MADALSEKRQAILEHIATCVRERGYPPSVREIGEAVGLSSAATVHSHLKLLEREGYLVRHPTKPRAIEVRYDPDSHLALSPSPVRHVPLVGQVAAGTGVIASENVEGLLALPEEFTGQGTLFMLKVKGDSMVEAGILDGDHVVVRQQATADNGDIVVAGLPGEEATVKRLEHRGGKVRLLPANPAYDPIEIDEEEAIIYGKVVTVLRRL